MCFWIRLDEESGFAASVYYNQQDSGIWIFLYISSEEINLRFRVTPPSQQGHDLR